MPFETVQRVSVSDDELRKLGPSLSSFIRGFRPREYGDYAEADTTELIANQSYARNGNQPFRYIYKFRPQIDIDNDGRRDEVLINNNRNYCGGYFGNDPEPAITSSDILILTPSGSIDQKRTRALYDFAKRAYSATALASKSSSSESISDLWIRRFGVFKHNNVYYFDTLAPPISGGSGSSNGVYLVFRQKGQAIERICQMSVSASTEEEH